MNKNATCQKKMICTNTDGFYNGFAAVCVQMDGVPQEKWGLIDKTGKFVIPPIYDAMCYFGGKHIDVGIKNHPKEEENMLWGVVDLNNNIKIPFEYVEPDDYLACTLAQIGFTIKQRNDCEKVDVLDCHGKVIARYDDYSSVDTNEKRIHIINKGQEGYISPQGKILVPFIFYKIKSDGTLAQIEYKQRTYVVDWRKLRKFTRYYWLIKTITQTNGITFKNLLKRWQRSQWNNEEKFSMHIFHNHRKIIKEIFDIHIEYDYKTDKCCIEKMPENDIIEMWLEYTSLNNHLVYPYKSLQLVCTKIEYPLLQYHRRVPHNSKNYVKACFTEQIFGCVNKWGMMDKKGQLVIPPIYDDIFYWSGEKQAIVRIKNAEKVQNFAHSDYATKSKWGIVDLSNNTLFPFKCEEIDCLRSNGFSRFAIKFRGKWGIIDNSGNTIIPFEYDEIWEWEGYYRAYKNKKWGIISESGEVMIPFKYDEIWEWGNNFIVKKGKKWGVISQQEKVLIPLVYDAYCYHSFNKQPIALKSGKEWLFLNLQGKRVFVRLNIKSTNACNNQ